MEENIKILEEFTESSCCLASQEEIIECVKNLIKGYRELEEERNQYKGCFIVSMENSIPKSKIMKLKHELEEEYISLGKNKTEQSIHVMLGLNSAIDKISKLVEDK